MNTKASVLAIDDDPAVLKLVEAQLGPQGYRVVTASNGSDGLDKAVKEKPEFVILDVSMPTLSGFEVCHKLRALGECRNIPILMMTGKDKESDIVEALESGADDYLVKPVEAGLLIEKVAFLLKLAKEKGLPSQTYTKQKFGGSEKTGGAR